MNLAARLEGINKQFRTFTLISRSTYDQLEGSVPVREISRVAVVGRKEPVTVYEPMFQATFDRRKDVFAVFREGLKAYYAGKFPEAKRIFAKIEPRDDAAAAYLERCDELIANPPAEWSGVWTMESK